MEIKSYFLVIFVITILTIRIFLYIKPTPGPTILGFRTHHYMYGLVLAPIGIVFSSVTIYAVGVGLFVDELGYLLIGGKTHEDNYSKWSLILLGSFMVIIFFMRKQLLFWLN
jgi:hypothetical protein